jgi:NADPH:quinone reductase-like Zn-dependent oxidoreductase
MKQLADLLESGKVRAHVSQTFALEDMQKAHQAIERGGPLGGLWLSRKSLVID